MTTTVLVLGATGMLGHKLCQRLATRFDVHGTVRGDPRDVPAAARLDGVRLTGGVSAEDLSSVRGVIGATRPDVVINCIGIVKQLAAGKQPIPSIAVNALFPHQLDEIVRDAGARMIHFSTDCVFSGRAGNYTLDDEPDPLDLYGRTKLLGEVESTSCLTIRSSIVGHELRNHTGLIDWFLSQRGGEVDGFVHAVYSGLTTLAMASLVERAISEWPDLAGRWQVSSEPISKFDLLTRVNRVYGLAVTIRRDEHFVCDRSLDSSAFRGATGWHPPSWDDMVADMHEDYLLAEA